MDDTQHDQNTPRDALREFTIALVTSDAARLDACTVGEEIDREHARASMAFILAGRAFRERFIAAYGSEGWAAFNDNEFATLHAGGSRSNAEAEEAAVSRLDEYRVKVTGDSARATDPSNPDGVHIVRTNGRWMVSLRETTALPEKVLVSEAALFRGFVAVLTAKMDRIGADGVTPQSLDREVSEEFAPLLVQSER